MAAPITLYIDLEKDRKVDLEVVARASLSFAQAIREIAAIYDPFAEVRIELISGTEGSISLNAVVKWLKDKSGVQDELALKAAVISLSIWFAHEAGSWAVNRVLDLIADQHSAQTLHLSDEEAQKVAELVALTLERKIAQPQVQDVYRELERDSAVTGVGASLTAGQKPKTIVPRSEFKERSGVLPKPSPQPANRRSDTTSEKVRLISPVLLESNRRWRFSGRTGEFGAPINDQDFLHDLMAGNINLPMIAGIEFDILLEIVEEFKDGTWVVVERNVLKVLHVYPPIAQQSLLPEPPKLKDDSDED